jgi:tripartite-type tricarboxylate transporter receptor subunit TctC
MIMRCLLTSLTMAWIAGMTWIGAVAAQDYPARPITLVVPQAPGGGNDEIARIIADHMSRLLGQRIVVENRTGAGSRHATSRKERA